MKKNIMPLAVILGIVVIAVIAGTYFLTREPKINYQYDTAKKQSITEEIDVTGQVKAAQDIDLSFVVPGKIKGVFAHVGDKVKAGQILLSLDNADLAAQLAQAQAGLNKALAGNTPEYIAQLQAALDKAQNDLNQAQGSTPNVEDSRLVQDAYDNLFANLQAVQITLSSALTSADNILGVDNTMANESFSQYLSTSNFNKLNTAKTQYLLAKSQKADFDSIINALTSNSSHVDLDSAAQKANNTLLTMKDLLFDVSAVLDNTLSAGNFTQSALDGLKANMQAMRGTVVGAYTSLISQTHAIDTARNNYASLQTVVDRAQAALNDAKNPPRAVDVAGLRALVYLAAANYNKTILRSPIDGILAKQDGEAGNIVSPNIPIATVISNQKFQVETFVAETDVSKIKVGNPALITLDNLGNSSDYDAAVIKVDPASQTMPDGTSAYKVTLEFTKPASNIKAGLTANIKITTAIKNDVVVIPERDVVQKNGQYFVMVSNGNTAPVETKVETGIKSADGLVEIISGLPEGSQVVSFGI